MQKNTLYRSLFLLDDTRSYTNDFYIFEFVKIVLFESGCFTQNLRTIQNKIEQLTSLVYTYEDILHAISIWNNGDIECTDNENYSLTSKANTEISQREKNNNIQNYIDLFLKEYSDKYNTSKDDIGALIERFIFQRFNENLQQISDILNHKLKIDDYDDDYDDYEKSLINDFLNWNNSDKNRCVYTLIAKSYDYCMINSKCADSSFDFGKINFYLDTNIIFRLLGINGNLREASVKNLIEKCSSVGINMIVSNFVKDECEYTINSQINLLIDSTTQMNNLIPPSTMSFAEEKSIRIDFYNKYYEWVKQGNKHRNYDGFKKRIFNELNSLLKNFDDDSENTSYKAKKEEEFTEYCNSLQSIKSDKHIVETDVNSILHVLEQRKKNNNLEYFLISADRKLISWLREIFPQTKSIADYPSAWLSIILKYSGREKDTDYKAFCQFIHLTIEPKIEDLEKKISIKAGIMSCDLDEEIKVMMIDEVRNNYNQYVKYNTDKIIHMAYGKTKKAIEAEAEKQKKDEYNKTINEINIKYENKLRSIQDKYENEINNERKRSEAEYQRGKDDQERDEYKRQKQQIIYKKISFNKKIRMIFKITAWVILFLCLASWIWLFIKGHFNSDNLFINFLNTNSLFISGLLTFLDIILFLIPITINGKTFFPVDAEIIASKIDKHTKK